MIFTTNLFIYHTGLVNKNMTTKEELKKHFKNPFGNFYSRSIGLNWKNVLSPVINKKSILDILKWENELSNDTTEKESVNVKVERCQKIEKISMKSENTDNSKGKKVSTASSNVNNEIDPNEIVVEDKKSHNSKNQIKSNGINISKDDDYTNVADTSSFSQRKNIPKFDYKLDMNTSILNSQ